MDEPVANATIIPMLELAKFAKSKVAVALSGEGGDEIFGGYARYKKSRLLDLIPIFSPTALARHTRFMFQKDEDIAGLFGPAVFTPSAASNYFRDRYAGYAAKNSTEALMHIDEQTWLVDEALLRSDKMAMASGLEVRVPLLNKTVRDFASQMRVADKVSVFDSKIAFKNAFKDDLPDWLFGQPKRGFTSPAAKWLRDPGFLTYTREVLSSGYNLQTAELFNWGRVSQMLEAHVSKSHYAMNTIWSLLIFQIWVKKFDVKV
jgi:asparagine synthase (glutamine-hydrolysing)